MVLVSISITREFWLSANKRKSGHYMFARRPQASSLVPTHSKQPKFGLRPWRTLREALDTLTATPCDYVRFPEKRLRFYRMLKEGQNWRNLPKELQQEALGNSFFAGGGKTGS